MTPNTPAASKEPLLHVQDLSVHFRRARGATPLRAVDDVTFSIAPRETLGLVGESGSGKSTIGRAILGLTKPTSGRVEFQGRDITHAGQRQRRDLSHVLQVIFQDPYSSLNPTRTVGQTLGETLRAQSKAGASEVDTKTSRILQRVGLDPSAANRFPTQFSGGQRQRIAIARALIGQPRLVVCDEPVSALDLSVQAQVMNLLRELQAEFELSYLFIAHDLDVVRHLSHRIMVLYRGQVMEEGTADGIYSTPRHPYTKALLNAAPIPDPQAQRARAAARVKERPVAAPSQSLGDGCPFAPRCPYAQDRCRSERPQLEPTDGASLVACHRWREIGETAATSAFGSDPKARRGQTQRLAADESEQST